MSGNHPKAETIDFTKARLVSTFNDMNKQLQSPEDKVSRLSRRLQTSLDLATIVRIFCEEIATLVTFDHYEFYSRVHGIQVGSEKRAVHSCDYALTLENDTLGHICFTRSKKFKEEELAIIEHMLGSLVYPLRNAILYKQALEAALTDSLTNAGNKRALDAHLHREAELSRRHNSPFSVLLFDLDKFKNINDTFGHSAGDEVLRLIVKCISDNARKCDLCFRAGGEEFVLVLNGTHHAGARIIAERIRQRIQDSRFYFADKEIPVTVSMGTATFRENETIAEMMNRADKALYKAKADGRNQVYSSEALERKQAI
jgi:diguanylate cyclase (GGDEF)-like protein